MTLKVGFAESKGDFPLHEQYLIVFTVLGTIGIGGTGSLQLSAKMKGIWEEAFNIKYLSFGNLALSVGIMPGNPVPSFSE